MKAWAIKKYGDNSQVMLLELPLPEIQDDEVLVRVKAASINPVDFKIRDGKLRFVLRYKFPLILGNDCAGVVEKVSPAVKGFKLGDEVYTRPHKEQIGTLAEFIAVKEEALSLKPHNLSFDEAASIPLVGLTSWQALVTKANIKKGDKVFIPAGSGGVGSFAIQLAKYFGAYVITNTSTKNLEFVKSLGADEVIDYKKEDFSKRISEVDIVLDTMGGETQRKSFSVLKPGRTLISIVSPPTVDFLREVNLGPLLQVGAFLLSFTTNRRAKAKKATYQFLFMLPDGQCLGNIKALIEQGHIRPVIDKAYPFSQAKDALAHVEAGHSRGKVIVSLN